MDLGINDATDAMLGKAALIWPRICSTVEFPNAEESLNSDQSSTRGSRLLGWRDGAKYLSMLTRTPIVSSENEPTANLSTGLASTVSSFIARNYQVARKCLFSWLEG